MKPFEAHPELSKAEASCARVDKPSLIHFYKKMNEAGLIEFVRHGQAAQATRGGALPVDSPPLWTWRKLLLFGPTGDGSQKRLHLVTVSAISFFSSWRPIHLSIGPIVIFRKPRRRRETILH